MGIFHSNKSKSGIQRSSNLMDPINDPITAQSFMHPEPLFKPQAQFSRTGSMNVQKSPEEAAQDPIWIQDGDGNLYYKTQAEAINRQNKLEALGEWEEYRVVSFTNSQGEFWRVEMKGAKAVASETAEQSESDSDGYVYKETDVNVYQAWKRLKEEGQTILGWSEFQELNGGEEVVSHLAFGTVLKLSKPTDDATSKVKIEAAGDLTSNKIMYIAWTIDDGPFGSTTALMKTTGLEGIKNVTWYIQRWRLGNGDSKYLEMKAIQDQGGEIAIHSFHPTADHVPWFPLTGGSSAYSFPYKDSKQSDLMTDLKSFDAKLKTYGIKPKFARLPGGLTSELVTYGTNLGYSNADASAIRTKILNGEDVSSHGANALKIEADYKLLKSTLSELDLLLWGGGMIPEQIKGQSWEAETSGNKYRTDNTTKAVSPERKDQESNPGIFESKIKDFKENERRSLVILAHDTTASDASAVLQDKQEIERLAKVNGIRIEYVTMSTIFEKNTGIIPSKYDVDYK